ncbi:MAG: DinB family protein [Nocardioides sp.]
MPIEPDTKDWTWVLREPCPDCGFDAAGVDVADLPALIRDTVPGFLAALADEDARVRPADNVWSPLEYACHVRDAHVLFDLRVRQLLNDEDPLFANWDQDATAVADDYAGQDPAAVGPALAAAAELVAATYDEISGDQWQRPGRRSDGAVFTADTLGRYHLHDVVHHLDDIGYDPRSMTVAAYSGSAEAYAAGTIAMPDSAVRLLDRFAATLGAGARVLEIGTGPGRDALALEKAGLVVRRTDVTPGFVELLHAQGHAADLLDPLTDDLLDPADPRQYDAVWASACLLHVARPDLPVVLSRLAEATREGGLFQLSLKEGDGARWSTHGNVDGPRYFTYWREEPLRAAIDAAGWSVVTLEREDGQRGETWFEVLAERRA